MPSARRGISTPHGNAPILPVNRESRRSSSRPPMARPHERADPLEGRRRWDVLPRSMPRIAPSYYGAAHSDNGAASTRRDNATQPDARAASANRRIGESRLVKSLGRSRRRFRSASAARRCRLREGAAATSSYDSKISFRQTLPTPAVDPVEGCRTAFCDAANRNHRRDAMLFAVRAVTRFGTRRPDLRFDNPLSGARRAVDSSERRDSLRQSSCMTSKRATTASDSNTAFPAGYVIPLR